MSTMEKLLSRFRKIIESGRFVDDGALVLVAVSGGPDSVALLYLLYSILNSDNNPFPALRLHVVHMDHGFRGDESRAEADFVRRLAARLGLPCTVAFRDVPAFQQKRRASAQMAARELRYQFFRETAARMGAERVALGHQKDDAVETCLLHIFQGSGLAGLASIPEKRDIFIRPLLDFSRNELIAYLNEHGLEWCTDSSNLKSMYRRNWIRNELLPLIESRFPSASENISRLIKIAGQENAFQDREREKRLGPVRVRSDAAVRYSLAALRDIPIPLLIRDIFRECERLQVRPPGYDFFSRIPDYLANNLANNRPGRIWFASKMLFIEEHSDFLELHRKEREQESIQTGHSGIAGQRNAKTEKPEPVWIDALATLPVELRYPWGSLRLSQNEGFIEGRNFFHEQAKNAIFFVNINEAMLPLQIGPRRQGERIRLRGTGTKKLKDLLIDLRVPARERPSVLVLRDSGESPLGCLIPAMPEHSRIAEAVMLGGDVAWQSRHAITLRLQMYLKH